MKQTFLAILFTTCSFFLNAQTDLYFKIKKLISETHPEIITDHKLIAFNSWSTEDPESREANKSFEKAYKVYEYARLKGGLKGIVVITISKDNLSGMANITLKKDGVTKLIAVKADEIKGFSSVTNRNVVFDSNGNTVYQNLAAAKIFESINQLITR